MQWQDELQRAIFLQLNSLYEGYPIKFALGYLAGAHLRFDLLCLRVILQMNVTILHENLHLQVLCKIQLF